MDEAPELKGLHSVCDYWLASRTAEVENTTVKKIFYANIDSPVAKDLIKEEKLEPETTAEQDIISSMT